MTRRRRRWLWTGLIILSCLGCLTWAVTELQAFLRDVGDTFDKTDPTW